MLCFHQKWAGWVSGLNVRRNSLSRLLLFNPSCTRSSSSWKITSSKLVHAKKVWIWDCLRILPFSGHRLRILLDSSIDVIPKEAKLHVLLNPGQTGWFHPDAIWRVATAADMPHPMGAVIWGVTENTLGATYLPSPISILPLLYSVSSLLAFSLYESSSLLSLYANVVGSSKDNSVLLHTSSASSACTVQTERMGGGVA